MLNAPGIGSKFVCHIQCYRSIHRSNFDQLAGFGHQVVFRNFCSSSHELAIRFLNAGAPTLQLFGRVETKLPIRGRLISGIDRTLGDIDKKPSMDG